MRQAGVEMNLQIISGQRSGKTALMRRALFNWLCDNPGKTALVVEPHDSFTVTYAPPLQLPEGESTSSSVATASEVQRARHPQHQGSAVPSAEQTRE